MSCPGGDGSRGNPRRGFPLFFVAFLRRGGVRFALSQLVEGRLVSAWGVVPVEDIPSALGHNVKVSPALSSS